MYVNWRPRVRRMEHDTLEMLPLQPRKNWQFWATYYMLQNNRFLYTLFLHTWKNNIISKKNIILFYIANTRCSLHEHARPDRPAADFIPSLLILDSADSNFTKFSLLIIWYIFLYTLVALSLKNQYPFLRAIPHYRRHKMWWEDCHNIYSRTELDKLQHKNAVVAVVERQTSLFCLLFVQKILLYMYM